ncbi:hypothetical protein PC9H_011274 [Pleurotus ostreatus]|uniref:Uncharacterized protein n=1 Tax=Pleurotus ostreatus TaxID=5322 RepID=A0A8H6ZQ82_PLEOS|nr:uncharacterized protein PC9H_011274 [Pleurotus ostreatus]KAF7420756.1 hypothetical protein PC9H_011274 [Pleurotus ostreatus]
MPGFEELDDGRVKCILCTAYSLQPVELFRKSISKHCKTERHLKAEKDRQNPGDSTCKTASGSSSQLSLDPEALFATPITIPFVNLFAAPGDEKDIPDTQTESVSENIFTDWDIEDGQFTTPCGDSIMFTTGHEQQAENSHQSIWATIAGLRYLSEHTAFSGILDAISEVPDEDTSIPDATAAIDALEHDEDDQSTADAAEDVEELEETNGDWAPYGSKTVKVTHKEVSM